MCVSYFRKCITSIYKCSTTCQPSRYLINPEKKQRVKINSVEWFAHLTVKQNTNQQLYNKKKQRQTITKRRKLNIRTGADHIKK